MLSMWCDSWDSEMASVCPHLKMSLTFYLFCEHTERDNWFLTPLFLAKKSKSFGAKCNRDTYRIKVFLYDLVLFAFSKPFPCSQIAIDTTCHIQSKNADAPTQIPATQLKSLFNLKSFPALIQMVRDTTEKSHCFYNRWVTKNFTRLGLNIGLNRQVIFFLITKN